MHHPTARITHTTAFVTPVVEHWFEREITPLVHHEGSIRLPIASYHGATSRSTYKGISHNAGISVCVYVCVCVCVCVCMRACAFSGVMQMAGFCNNICSLLLSAQTCTT